MMIEKIKTLLTVKEYEIFATKPKRDFLAIMSHEICISMNAIIVMSQKD
jgi:hypothetical protein